MVSSSNSYSENPVVTVNTDGTLLWSMGLCDDNDTWSYINHVHELILLIRGWDAKNWLHHFKAGLIFIKYMTKLNFKNVLWIVISTVFSLCFNYKCKLYYLTIF